ncbi:hypothetical protein MAUB1S_09410 [Mycolicibacterium aubagnense]
MVTYNFHRLSPYDFEELVRDLLQAEWNIRLETFTTGPDSGIDLRCFSAGQGTTIIQCKHMQGSSCADLIRKLRQSEVGKVKKLSPHRYLLVTSLGLTPANKEEIVAIFSPYLRSSQDVVGRDDLNNLLRRHPTVEASNFKLWLTSTAVIQRVLHNAEHCQTEFEVDRVIEKLPVFVQSDAYPRAQKILAETQTVVISGVPGIGKTTLADMLLYSHMEQGYEPVVVQSGITEAKRLFDKSRSQIFYFDDFLGATFFQGRSELIDRNQDASLIAFIDAIRRSKRSRFVLTTREHVLRNALAQSERLAHSDILGHRCVLELEDYSYSQKARILYNHLYFSDLPAGYKEAILADDFYLTIVKHTNFVPRIIEWLSGYIRIRQVPPDQYKEHVAALLDSPERIWSHAFEHQISNAARSLLLALGCSRYGIDLEDLEPVWLSLHQHRARRYNFSTAPSDFRRALDETEGSFIQLRDMRVNFANPSIHDFIDNVLRSSAEHIEDVLISAVRFTQVKHLFDLAKARPSPTLTAYIASEPSTLLAAIERVLYGPHLRWTKRPGQGMSGTFFDTYPEHRLQSLVSWAEYRRSTALLRIVNLLASYLLTNWSSNLSPDIGPAITILEAIDAAPWVSANGGAELRIGILDAIIGHLYLARYYEWNDVLEYHEASEPWSPDQEVALDGAIKRYKEDGIDEEAGDCSTSELEELRDGLAALQKERGLSLETQISRLQSRLDLREEDDFDSPSFMPHSFPTEKRPKTPAPANDEEIWGLFRTLMD